MASLEVRHTGDVTIVNAAGDLDTTLAGVLRRCLVEAAEAGNPLLLVDMAEVVFLDSAGLAVLVGIDRTLRPGRRLALCNVPARMQRMLEVAAIGLVLQIHNAGEPWPFPCVPAPAGPGAAEPKPGPEQRSTPARWLPS
jgi:anti-anti-sigma factor